MTHEQNPTGPMTEGSVATYERCTRPDCLNRLRLLALPYADHPDYDPAWRP